MGRTKSMTRRFLSACETKVVPCDVLFLLLSCDVDTTPSIQQKEYGMVASVEPAIYVRIRMNDPIKKVFLESMHAEDIDWDKRDFSQVDVVVDLYTLGVILYLLRIALQRIRVWFYQQQKRKSKLSGLSFTPPTSLSSDGDDDRKDPSQSVNLSGTWQLVENRNFEAFLEAQGVPYLLREAANKARPLHIITHHDKELTIQIKGIVESQTTYIIDGPPVLSEVRGRIFQDSVSFLTNGVQVLKRCDSEQYMIRVCRRLSRNGRQITLTSTAVFDDQRPSIESVQIFERVTR